MHRTVVLDVVGLTSDLIGEDTPHLQKFSQAGALRSLATVFPAVTCPVQATLTTGTLPREHGVVSNGWYFRELEEVMFWRQSNRLVNGEEIWEVAMKRDPSFTCAKLFWWYNMYSAVDFSVTPRPIYWADGLKIPDIYTEPPELRDDLNHHLGPFPLFHFWGPNADVLSSQWIARCAKYVYDTRKPSLTLVYLPHLDYDLQRFGPTLSDPRVRKTLREIDSVAGDLLEHFGKDGARIIVLSEYGITPVDQPVHVNRALREAGLLRVRLERGLEKLDAGASQAFAVADHQVAHVYVRDRDRLRELRDLCAQIPGVAKVLDEEGKASVGLDHPRSGELVLVACPNAWFSYYYWLDDTRAPEFARTVDIHRKPGYDPAELFLDPDLAFPKLKVGFSLAKKILGFRYMVDVIPLNADLIRGSHGRLPDAARHGPVFMTSETKFLARETVDATEVKDLVLRHLFER